MRSGAVVATGRQSGFRRSGCFVFPVVRGWLVGSDRKNATALGRKRSWAVAALQPAAAQYNIHNCRRGYARSLPEQQQQCAGAKRLMWPLFQEKACVEIRSASTLRAPFARMCQLEEEYGRTECEDRQLAEHEILISVLFEISSAPTKADKI